MRRAAAVLLALSAGCSDCRRPHARRDPQAPTADRADRRPAREAPALRAFVAALAMRPDLERAVTELALDEAGFARAVVPSYRGLFAAYARHSGLAARALAAELADARAATPPDARGATPPGAAPPTMSVRERRHYSGDPTLSPAQARTRWAQPVQSESWLVEVNGHLLDTVWVSDRGRWRSLHGLSEAALAQLEVRECAAAVATAGAPGPCSDAAWGALDATLRGASEAAARACARAQVVCTR